MRYRKLSGILWLYISSLVLAVLLLPLWVIYVLFAQSTINELISSRMGVTGHTDLHWLVLGGGSLLLIILIVGISLQLAQGISEYLYSRKQREFVANVTHELKTPLSAITLHTQTLMNGDVDAKDAQLFLTSILGQAQRMTELVNNVLEIARLNDGRSAMKLEVMSIHPFLTAYATESALRVANRSIHFAFDKLSGTKILANPVALTRVLNNLIDNAIKACPNGEDIGCTGTLTQGNHVEIEIWDKGVGIPPKEQKKVFKRFYQIGDEITGRRKGTGLGLAIVKGLMKDMKGHIRLVSNEGHGARFTLQFTRCS